MATPPLNRSVATEKGFTMMNAIGDSAGSAIVGLGGILNMMLAAVGSGDLAGSLSETVYRPLLGSVAPGFVI